MLFCIGCNDKQDIWDSLAQNGSEEFQEIWSNPEKYELQILYTQLDKDVSDSWTLHQARFRVDTTHYFYPASTVKMPVAFLALQKLNELQEQGYTIDKNTPVRSLKSRDIQTAVDLDSTSATGHASIAHYINKLFAVSDNDAYNRLYEFLGRDYINEELRRIKAFSNSRINTRVGVGGFDYEENAHTNAMEFYKDNKLLYSKAAEQAKGNYLTPLKEAIKGKGYFETGEEEAFMKPFDMSKKNFVSLVDLQESLQRVIIPEYYLDSERFRLKPEDYGFLRAAMSNLPRSYSHPSYDSKEYYDSYVKFFLYGDSKEDMPAHIKIYNKVGYAYGTLTDCAFIEDTTNNIQFFLSATLLVNENEIFNDNTYEYDKGIAFLAELGRLIYEEELRSKNKN